MRHSPAMSPQTIAGVDVTPLCDAIGPMGESLRRPPDELFSGASDELWARLRDGEPDAFTSTGDWKLHFHCFLMRDAAGRHILVDTGVGDADSPAASWAPVPGRLLGALAEAGLSAADIDVVVLTHLHSDHASGCMTGGEPTFPNARYLLQQAELDWLDAAGTNPVTERIIRPLQRSGLLDVVHGRTGLAPVVDAVPTPGHTPGHQSVVLDDHRLVVAGDVVLHPVQLADPAVTYLYDVAPQAAAATRHGLLDRIRARDGLLAAPHLAAGFLPVRSSTIPPD